MDVQLDISGCMYVSYVLSKIAASAELLNRLLAFIVAVSCGWNCGHMVWLL